MAQLTVPSSTLMVMMTSVFTPELNSFRYSFARAVLRIYSIIIKVWSVLDIGRGDVCPDATRRDQDINLGEIERNILKLWPL